jgi:hypothetical protein
MQEQISLIVTGPKGCKNHGKGIQSSARSTKGELGMRVGGGTITTGADVVGGGKTVMVTPGGDEGATRVDEGATARPQAALRYVSSGLFQKQ